MNYEDVEERLWMGHDYKDVYLMPCYSDIESRTVVDVTGKIFKDMPKEVPVISANMDTITEYEMAQGMYYDGGIGALHRFMPIEENVEQYKLFFNPDNPQADADILVSLGVNGDGEKRAEALHTAGARNFIIDIAHGHSVQMKNMIKRLKSRYHSKKDPIRVMAGNVATWEACMDLQEWGADAIKVGIGPGAACLTKNVTGVTIPQFSAIYGCAQHGFEIPLIADGGITEIGDIAKALAAGASAVMCGRLFASCMETPGPRLNGKKIYRGMASKDAMLRIKPADSLPTPEGATLVIDEELTHVTTVMQHIQGGLQSSFSYLGARNLEDFQKNAQFGSRK